MVSKVIYGFGGAAVGALALAAASAFSGISPSEAIPTLLSIAQTVTKSKEQLKTDDFHSTYNRAFIQIQP